MNVMKKNKLAGKFSLLHRLNTDTVIIGLLPGINVNELTSTDLRYLAAFYLGGAVYRNSKHCWFENDFNMDCVYPEYNFQE